MMRAAAAKNAGAVPLLVAAGADMQAQDKQGKTALMRAAEEGHLEVVEALLNAGADPRVRDASGKSALDYARARDAENYYGGGRSENVTLLAEAVVRRGAAQPRAKP